MKYRLHLTFSFVCVAIFAGQLLAQGIGDRNRPAGRGNYKIVGRIYMPDGKPGVDIDVNASGGEFSGQTARTDQDGKFAISGLSSGNYSIVIRQKGYVTESELVTIPEGATSGQTYQLSFNLRLVGEPKKPAKTSAATGDIPADARAKYEEAMAFLTKDDPAKALPLLDQATKSFPDFAAAYYEKGAAHLKLKAYDKSIEAFVKAISLKPDYVEAKYGYGMANFGMKNYSVAEAAFRDVLKQKNDMAEAHLNLGMALFHQKMGIEAETELKSAVSMKGGEKLALGHLYLGQIYMMKKDNPSAIAELQKYVDMVPKAPNAEKIRSVIADLKKQS
ncbi:MAG: tetratricopeptide repeat protein [Pyrinomonadaceae bacterium]